ncbi:hypothetical protein M1M86_00955 [Dehalococcoidales bacterium]|nr:hypothetical protein [Dehalococcoidales bacterium]
MKLQQELMSLLGEGKEKNWDGIYGFLKSKVGAREVLVVVESRGIRPYSLPWRQIKGH